MTEGRTEEESCPAITATKSPSPMKPSPVSMEDGCPEAPDGVSIAMKEVLAYGDFAASANETISAKVDEVAKAVTAHVTCRRDESLKPAKRYGPAQVPAGLDYHYRSTENS